MSERTRYALYYTPAPGSALAAFGQEILGDSFGDSLGDSRLPDWSEADRDALAAITEEPRVYGFHATLKAPMRLAPDAGEQDLLAACLALAAHRRPILVGRLVLRPIGDFLALVPEEPCPALGLFAAECVAALDPLRAPLTAAERARRRPDRLDARRRALLDRWGYPHVFEAFRFHMTLTGRLSPEQRDAWFARLSQVCPEIDLAIDAITLLHQIGNGPFRVLRRLPFES